MEEWCIAGAGNSSGLKGGEEGDGSCIKVSVAFLFFFPDAPGIQGILGSRSFALRHT